MNELTRYVFARVCRPLPLLLELEAAGLHPGMVNPLADATEVDLPPEEFDRAATVVAAHDPAALDAAAAADAADDTTNRDTARTAVATLNADIAALGTRAQAFRDDAATMPATLTAAQVRGRLISIENGLADLADIVAFACRVLVALIGYLGRRGL